MGLMNGCDKQGLNGLSFISRILEDRPTTASFILGHDLVDQYRTF
jgi:hypothetical protein